MIRVFYNLLTVLLEYIDPTMHFPHFFLIFTKSWHVNSHVCCSPKCISETWPFQKSDAGIYHVFSQYFSNYYIFKYTCGWWTRNIITNWSGLISGEIFGPPLAIHAWNSVWNKFCRGDKIFQRESNYFKHFCSGGSKYFDIFGPGRTKMHK